MQIHFCVVQKYLMLEKYLFNGIFFIDCYSCSKQQSWRFSMSEQIYLSWWLLYALNNANGSKSFILLMKCLLLDSKLWHSNFLKTKNIKIMYAVEILKDVSHSISCVKSVKKTILKRSFDASTKDIMSLFYLNRSFQVQQTFQWTVSVIFVGNTQKFSQWKPSYSTWWHD